MKCFKSNKSISIFMALICIMSSLSFKINVDKKETILSESKQINSPASNVFFVADDVVNSFKVNNKPVPTKPNTTWFELQQVNVDLKSGDWLEFCISNGSGQRSDSGNPAMFVCTIYYGNKSISTDKTWRVSNEESEELASVSNPVNNGWKGINYGPIIKDAKLIWNKYKTNSSCFVVILP